MIPSEPAVPVRVSVSGEDVGEAVEMFSAGYGIRDLRTSSSGVPFAWGHSAVGDELATYRTSTFFAELAGSTHTGEEFIVLWNGIGRTEIMTGRESVRFGTGAPVVLPTDRTFSFRHDTVKQNLVHLSRSYVEGVVAETASRSGRLTFDTSRAVPRAGVGLWNRAVHRAAAALARSANPIVLEEVRRDMAHVLLDVFAHNAPDLIERPHFGPAKVTAAEDFIHAHAHLPITPTDVARAVDLGARGLQQAFQRHLGTTPTAVIRNARLDGARARLLAGSRDTTSVSEVAFAWGFAHLGRFSAAYRDRFGELPRNSLDR